MLVTLTRPRHTDLTTLATVRADLGLQDDVDDVVLAAENALLARYIRQASGAIARATDRSWGRGAYRETFTGSWTQALMLGSNLMLEHTPVVALGQVLIGGDPFTDYTLDDGAGFLEFVENIGPWYPSWSGSFQVDYTAGYLLPSDDLTSNLIGADQGLNALTHAQAGFPLLVPGDVIQVAGFLAEQNTGTATIVTATASTLVLDGLTLDDAPAAEDITLTVHTLPDDVEGACVNTVRAYFLSRQWALTGPRVIQSEGGTQFLSMPSGALSKEARELLKPFMRVI
jgi:hypothetical protein